MVNWCKYLTQVTKNSREVKYVYLLFYFIFSKSWIDIQYSLIKFVFANEYVKLPNIL